MGGGVGGFSAPPVAVMVGPDLNPEEMEIAKEIEQMVRGSNAKDPRVKLMIKRLTKKSQKVVEHLKAKGIL